MAIGQHPAEHSNQAHLQDRPRSIGLSLPVNCQGLPGASNKARISSTVDGFQRIYAAVVPLFLTRGGGFYGYETTLDVATLLLFPGHRTDGKFDGVNIEGNLHFRRKSTARDGRIPLGISDDGKSYVCFAPVSVSRYFSTSVDPRNISFRSKLTRRMIPKIVDSWKSMIRFKLFLSLISNNLAFSLSKKNLLLLIGM